MPILLDFRKYNILGIPRPHKIAVKTPVPPMKFVGSDPFAAGAASNKKVINDNRPAFIGAILKSVYTLARLYATPKAIHRHIER